MTLLYRTPNVSLAGFEFHATVESHHGQVARHYRWRRPRGMWRKLADWEPGNGHPPKMREVNLKFQTFRRHMQWALRGAEPEARCD